MTPRPRLVRRVRSAPGASFFKPAGIRMAALEQVILSVEEFESMRLMDREGLKQVEACERMGVSQPTFQRVYESARRKVADALVEGKAIRIEGGHFRFSGRLRRGKRDW